MKSFEIDIDAHSCKAHGVGSDEFEQALKSEFDEEYALKIFFTASPDNGHFREGYSRLGLSNPEKEELNDVTRRVVNVFQGLVASGGKIT